MKTGKLRFCKCGCGKVAKKHVYDKRFKSWRLYAAGHAPNEAINTRIPEAREDVAYAAGIIDGEGCIYARVAVAKTVNTVLALRVSMCSEKVIRWLTEKFGGELYIPSDKHHKVQQFVWQVRGRRMIPVLYSLLPFLIEKKQRALLAIQLAELIRDNKYRKLPSQEVEERQRLAAAIKQFNRNPSGEDMVVN